MKFNTDFEYDEWFDVLTNKDIVDDYFGREIKMEVEDGRGEESTSRNY